jgi:hypothetical protein
MVVTRKSLYKSQNFMRTGELAEKDGLVGCVIQIIPKKMHIIESLQTWQYAEEDRLEGTQNQ